MVDRVSVSSHHSYGSRVGNSLKAILWWIVLVIGSIALLAWNENNYVKQKAALEEWASLVQEATADSINSDLDKQEIHVSGQTASDAEALQDSTFWIITDDLKLKRTVEMYQWYEESEEECVDNVWWSEDCTTTYTYDTKWDDEPINSNNFYQTSNHENPSTWKYESQERVKDPITLWVYTLNPVFVSQLTNYKIVNLSEQNVIIPEEYNTVVNQVVTQNVETTSVEDNNNSYLYGDDETSNTTSDVTTVVSSDNFHVNGDLIYIWLDPSHPAVWDLRITFSSIKPSTVSVVWKQMGSEITSYTVSNWRSISLLEEWNVTAEDMFQHALDANKNMTWIIRIVWLFLMYCGFAMMLKFIETIAKVLPFLANIIWVGTGIVALWLTLVVWLLTIGIAWLAVRPVIWICCLVVAVAGIFLMKKSKKDKKADLPKEEKIEEKPEIIE